MYEKIMAVSTMVGAGLSVIGFIMVHASSKESRRESGSHMVGIGVIILAILATIIFTGEFYKIVFN